MHTADNICKMFECLIDNIFVQFGGSLSRQAIGIPMGTNCAPLLADLFFTHIRTRGPADLLVDTGQGLNAPKAQVRGHVTRRQPK